MIRPIARAKRVCAKLDKFRWRIIGGVVKAALTILALIGTYGTCSAGSLCLPKDSNARILSAPSPMAIDPQWTGDSHIGTGWSFYVTQKVNSATGAFAKGNLHGTRGGIAQKDVYVLLSEWTCNEAGPEESEGIERVDSDVPSDTLPRTFSVRTESGRLVDLVVTNFGRFLPTSKNFEGIKTKDSENAKVRSYHMNYRMVPVDKVVKEDGLIVGYELLIPPLRRNESLIVNYATERPFEVAEGGTGYEDIKSPWIYRRSDSGTRILFSEFNGPQTMDHLGEWQLDLVVNGNVLVSRKFTLLDATGKDHSKDGLEDNSANSVPFANLIGTWAHTAEACKIETAEGLDNVTRRQSEMIGICGNEVDLLYEAFRCTTETVDKVGAPMELDMACRTKDYEPEKQHVQLKSIGTNALQFSTPNFAIKGDYVRCSQAYSCDR